MMMMMNNNNHYYYYYYYTTAAATALCITYEHGIFALILQVLKFPLEVVVRYSTSILDNSI